MSYLCLKRDIKEGEYNVFEGFDGQSYLVQKSQGRITVAENRCPHRGFRLADCGGKGSIRCKLHGQRFDFKTQSNHYEFGEFIFLPAFLGRSELLTDLSTQIGEEITAITTKVSAPFHLFIQYRADIRTIKQFSGKMLDSTEPEDVYISEFESAYTLRVSDEVKGSCKRNLGVESGDYRHILAFPSLSISCLRGAFTIVESVVPEGKHSTVKTRIFAAPGVGQDALSQHFKSIVDETTERLGESAKKVEEWARNYSFIPSSIKWLPGEQHIKRYAEEIQARGLE